MPPDHPRRLRLSSLLILNPRLKALRIKPEGPVKAISKLSWIRISQLLYTTYPLTHF